MKIGLVIVVVALFGAVLAGSIGVGEETRTAESFDRVTDLAPIVSYSSVEEQILYNPPQNITGWSGASFTYQDAPSLYSYVEGGTTTSSTFTTSAPVGVYYTSSASSISGTSPVVLWNDNSSGWVEQPVMSGGYRTSATSVVTGNPYYKYYYADTYVNLYHTDLNTTEAAVVDGDPIFFNSLNQIAIANNWPTGTTVTAAGATSGAGIYIDNGTSFSSQYRNETSGANSYTYRTSATLTQNVSTTSSTYWWAAETAAWYLIEGYLPSGIPSVTSVAYNLVLVGTAASGQTVDLVTYDFTQVKYIKPNTEATVPDTTAGAVWQNGYDNTAIDIIVQPEATISTSGYEFTLPSASAVYVRCLVHIDLKEGSYWQGITRYTSPADYDVVDYQEELQPTTLPAPTESITLTMYGTEHTYVYTIPVGTRVTIRATPVNQIENVDWDVEGNNLIVQYFSNFNRFMIYGTLTQDTTVTLTGDYELSGNAATWNIVLTTTIPVPTVTVTNSSTVYVLNTWMPRDSQDLLWGDPSFDAAAYFPDLMPLRVQINAAVLTGDTLTVNGSTMTVTDNSLELAVDGGTVLVPISGMGIEWRADGNTYIVAADGTSYSLGTTTSTAVSGTGSWYLSGEVQQITTSTVTVLVPIYADAPTAAWSIFAFIGLCIGGAVVMLAVGRSSLVVTDWAIIIGAAIIGVMLL